MADAAAEPIQDLAAFQRSVLSHQDSPIPTGDSQIPGLSSLHRSELEPIRLTVGYLHWLANLSVVLFKDQTSARQQMVQELSEKAAQMLSVTKLPQASRPFEPLSSFRTPSELATRIQSANFQTSNLPWGPASGCVKDCLSPASQLALCWMGKHYAQPVLDFLFAFAETPKSFAAAWAMCPVSHSMELDLLEARQKKLAGSHNVNAPGQAILHLATKASSSLCEVVESLVTTLSIVDITGVSISAFPELDLTQLLASEARQYRDCTAVITKVSTILPTQSSFPSFEPNFTPDPAAQWFQMARYAFSSINMPNFSALGSGAFSELQWHTFQCDVLHARLQSIRLSEGQVIQHLLSLFSRTDPHSSLARESSQTPNITVSQWLDIIRDFYFTSNQFRMNIERAWKNWDASSSKDFNDLSHHIKTYYRLIFVDYSNMASRLGVFDFAWLLFSKLQDLLEPSCSSPVSMVLRKYLPLTNLLDQMSTVLQPAQAQSESQQRAAGIAFLEWAIKQLVHVRSVANTVNVFIADCEDHDLDFTAHDTKQYRRSKQQPSSPKMAKPYRPRFQQQAAASSNPQPYANPKQSDSTQPPGPPPRPKQSFADTSHTVQRGRKSDSPGFYIPDLRKMSPDTDANTFSTWLDTVLSKKNIDPALVSAIRREHTGGPTSISALLSTCQGQIPKLMRDLQTPQAVILALIKMRYVHAQVQCLVCPAGCEDGRHLAKDCPLLTQHCSKAALSAYLAEPANAARSLSVLPPAEELSQRQTKRGRYAMSSDKPAARKQKRVTFNIT